MGRRWGWRYERYSRYASYWPRYVPVAERRAKAERRIARLVKKGEKLDPVVLEGRTIARTFWGKAWCRHLEEHCDFWNRLGRGRSYVRNGSVCDLAIGPGWVKARVVGNDLYNVEIQIKKLSAPRWKALCDACTGGIASVVELLQGRLSGAVMSVITDPRRRLFPGTNEIKMSCSCPDYATMCKHVAATLYGVGARLDSRPELFFVLRGVDHAKLIDEAVGSSALAGAAAGPPAIDESELSEIFGVEIERAAPSLPAGERGKKTAKKKTKKSGRKTRRAAGARIREKKK